MPKTETEKKLGQAIATLEKQFGKNIVVEIGKEEIPDVPVFSTGLLSIDYAIRSPIPSRKIGIGGIPRGRITELFGPESAGKSSLLWRIIAEVNRADERAAYIDAEHAADLKYAESFGVNVKELLFCEPEYGEQAFEVAQALIDSGSLAIVAIDSVAALVPKGELEGEMGDVQPGMHARMMTQAMRKLTGLLDKRDTALIVINQVREKIGGYGNPETTAGGRALRHHASLRIEIRKGETLKIGDKPVGSRNKFKVEKNKLGPPKQEALVDFLYGKGFSAEGDVLDFASKFGVVEKDGTWYKFAGERIAQGREESRKKLIEDVKLFDKIKKAALAAVGAGK